MLNETADKLLCVRGNCDADVDQMVLQFPILAEYCFLALEGVTICAAHGHRIGPDDPPPLQPGDYLLCGHIHIPVRRNCGTYTYLNPGPARPPQGEYPSQLHDTGKRRFHLARSCQRNRLPASGLTLYAVQNRARRNSPCTVFDFKLLSSLLGPDRESDRALSLFGPASH